MSVTLDAVSVITSVNRAVRVNRPSFEIDSLIPVTDLGVYTTFYD